MRTSEFLTLRRNNSSSDLKARLALEALETRVVPYATTGNAWPHPQLVTISFVPDGTNLGGATSNLFATFNAKWSTAAWENQILRAAQVWAERANLNFTVVADSGAATGSGNYEQGDPTIGDIRIGGYNFGSSTLATGFLPPPANNYSIAGDIEFNTGQVWAIGNTYDLFTVAAHEFGHALGMTHSTDATAEMYGTYNTRKTDLGSDDIAGIQSIYGARTPDRYDTGSGNNSFATASDITSQISSTSQTALVSNLDITTTSDVDYFTFTAPTGTSSSFTVNVQSKGLSLLCPALTVYAADQTTVLGSVTGLNRTGNTLSLTIGNVTAGQRFYLKVGGADTTAFGTGVYALTLNFGTGSSPTVVPPNTQTAATGTPQTGGGQANDTLLPNNVVTQTALGTVDTVSNLALVPGPGTQPHGPGCTCPACRNGGYAPAQIAAPPVTTVIERADSAAVSASALHPAGMVSVLGATIVIDGVGPAGAADSARASVATAAISSSLAGITTVAPIPPSTTRAPGAGISAAQSGAAGGQVSAEQAAPATDGPDASGRFVVEPGGEGFLPSSDPALPQPAALLSDSWGAPQSLVGEAQSESGTPEQRANRPVPVIEGRDIFWIPAGGMVAFLGLGGRYPPGRFGQRRRQGRGEHVGSERRRKTRYPCWLNSYCWPLGRPPIERCRSIAQDVSTEGVNLLLRQPFEEGTVLIAELEGSGGGLERCVVARVVHVLETAPGVWQLGCVFDRAVDEDAVRELLLGGLQERAAELLPENWEAT